MLQRATPFERILSAGLEMDRRLFEAAYACRGVRPVGWWMWIMAKSGDGPWYAVLALWMLSARIPGARHFLGAALVTFSVERILYFSLKHSFRRDRPYSVLEHISNTIEPLDRYSFPSGHTSGAFVMATLIHALFPAFALPAFVWAAGIGYSRIYHGIHYPADIVAGMVLGTSTAWFTLHFMGF